ncbi:MAG: toxic anion resistance protein [Solobacterium sp.]|nr:toxic anion resistance protein [Solobacterium sp.]MDD5843579.1 toxic anion resistance protein [Solobacterium sp.]MDD6834719.1 toxic anion resistance protein [Solobacterium sp.]MDY2730742.1 toxic anion resistance protein [Erysipelotrichaceae bacterium]
MEEEKITLTLESPAVEEEKEEVKEEEVKVTVDAAKLDDSGLSAEEKKMVEDFSKQIDITQTNAILQYGAAAQNKVADFSENALNKVKSKETGDVGEILSSLVNELKGFEIKEDEGFFSKMFKKTSNSVEGLKTKYDSAEKNVNKIVDILEEHQVTLLKDISLLDQLYAKNQTNLKELTMYILAGYKALDKYKNEDLPKALEKATKTGAPEDAQAANDLSNSINRFEKKLHDLELTRMVSVQMAPQIRLVQNNDTQMVEKIQSTIVNTIPLWKSQMLIALGINHSKEALKAQNEVTEMTNRMLKENAANLKMATIETAKQAERGIVDIETLTDTNKKLIETLEEVQHIQEDGRKKRAEAQVELRKIEAELQQKLTDVVNK